MDYKQTLNLPQTDFPMKANLAQREPEMLKNWEDMGIYQKIRKSAKGKKPYILHDGPPYANGNIHLGTALNKIIKDIVIKAKNMTGFDGVYVPGWDCHGLPIEHQVDKELGGKKSRRRRCRRWKNAAPAAFMPKNSSESNANNLSAWVFLANGKILI